MELVTQERSWQRKAFCGSGPVKKQKEFQRNIDMEQDSREIIDKIEGIVESKYKKLEDQLKSIQIKLKLIIFGSLIIGLLVGLGVPLFFVILILSCLIFLSIAYYVYCEKRSNSS